MSRKEDNKPFVYSRGNFQLAGRTEHDRKSVRLDTIMNGITRILYALATLLSVIISYIIYTN